MTTAVPKIDLHCHLEGAAPPDLVRRLAELNGLALPDGLFSDDGTFVWNGFLEFLKAYDLASSCIRTAEDYRRVTYEYLQGCAAEGGIYSEIFVSPNHAAGTGLSYAELLEGVTRGIEEAERMYGIIGRIIVTCVRHLGPQSAIKVARIAVAQPHRYVVGFGMGGDENSYTCEDFRPAFDLAFDAGLQCTVHAGEMAGAESVRDALKHLPISRIGHGVRSAEDEQLVDLLAAREIVLEICPSSNLAIGIYPSVEQHPLARLIEKGCKVVLGTDDPPYFATSIGREYHRAATNFKLGPEDIRKLNQNAIDGAFCDQSTKVRLQACL